MQNNLDEIRIIFDVNYGENVCFVMDRHALRDYRSNSTFT